MNTYAVNQEFNDLRWGTMMPVDLMVGSNYVQVCARGTCSVVVKDIQKLQEQLPDPADLPAFVRSQFTMAISNLLGELSSQVANVAQLTQVTGQTLQALESIVEPKLTGLGLQIKALKFEAIESI